MGIVRASFEHHPGWARALAALFALLVFSVSSGESKAGLEPPGPFVLTSSDSVAGTKTFEAEDFVLLSNSLGDLRLAVIGIVDRPFDSRQGLRFIFDDYENSPLHIVVSQSTQGVVSLTLAVLGVPALWFEKRPGESFVRHEGLFAPRTDAHRDQMVEYGIHTGRIEDFMKPAIDPELLGSLRRFKAFAAGFSGDLSFKLHGEPGESVDSAIQFGSCGGSLLDFSGEVLSLLSGDVECTLCGRSSGRSGSACTECAALTAAASASMIAAIVDWFDDDLAKLDTGSYPSKPPSAAEAGGGGQPALPRPYPIDGAVAAFLVPIYVIQAVDLCVDDVCEPETVVSQHGWSWIFP